MADPRAFVSPAVWTGQGRDCNAHHFFSTPLSPCPTGHIYDEHSVGGTVNRPKTYTAHRLDIYDTEMYVTTTARGWANIRRHVPFGELDTTAGGQTHSGQWQPDSGAPNENAIGIYINPKHRDDGEHLNTCAHEAAHAAETILRNAAMEPAGEALAYLVGWITRWLWENTR